MIFNISTTTFLLTFTWSANKNCILVENKSKKLNPAFENPFWLRWSQTKNVTQKYAPSNYYNVELEIEIFLDFTALMHGLIVDRGMSKAPVIKIQTRFNNRRIYTNKYVEELCLHIPLLLRTRRSHLDRMVLRNCIVNIV